MHGFQRLQALGSGDQEDALDPFRPGALEHVDGRDQGAAGGQHRIQDQRVAFLQSPGQLFEVGHGLQGFLVALQAHHADARGGDQCQHAGQHAQAGTQDGHQGDLGTGDLRHLHRARPARHGFAGQLQVGRRLVGQQRAQFGHQFAEILGVEADIPQQADLVLDEGVADFDGLHGEGRAAGGAGSLHQSAVTHKAESRRGPAFCLEHGDAADPDQNAQRMTNW